MRKTDGELSGLMSRPRRILVAGCGYVGMRAGELLAEAGHAVWGLRRRVALLPPCIRPVAADLTDPSSLGELPAGLDEAVFCPSAGGKGGADHYRAVYVDGLRLLLDRQHETDPPLRRLLMVSSTGVYGQHRGEWVDETSITEPSMISGRSILEAERLAGSFGRAVIVRLGGIYGPGRIRLIRSLRQGRAVCVRGRPRYLNQIHREDCAGVIEHLLALGRPDPVYVAADDEPSSRLDVWRWLAARLGVAGPRVVDPGDPDAPVEARGNKRCRNTRLRRSGYRFRYPTFRDGYGELAGAE